MLGRLVMACYVLRLISYQFPVTSYQLRGQSGSSGFLSLTDNSHCEANRRLITILSEN